MGSVEDQKSLSRDIASDQTRVDDKKTTATSSLLMVDRSRSADKAVDAAAKEHWVWEFDREAFRVPDFGGMFSKSNNANEVETSQPRRHRRAKSMSSLNPKDGGANKKNDQSGKSASSVFNPLYLIAGASVASGAVLAPSNQRSKTTRGEKARTSERQHLRGASQDKKLAQTNATGNESKPSFFGGAGAAVASGSAVGIQKSFTTEKDDKSSKRSRSAPASRITASSTQPSTSTINHEATTRLFGGGKRNPGTLTPNVTGEPNHITPEGKKGTKMNNKDDKNVRSSFNPLGALAGAAGASAAVSSSSSNVKSEKASETISRRRGRRVSSSQKEARQHTTKSDDSKHFNPFFLAAGATAVAGAPVAALKTSETETERSLSSSRSMNSKSAVSAASSSQPSKMSSGENTLMWTLRKYRPSRSPSESQIPEQSVESSDRAKKNNSLFLAAGAMAVGATAATALAAKPQKTSKASNFRDSSQPIEKKERISSTQASERPGFINPIASFFDELFEATDSEDEGSKTQPENGDNYTNEHCNIVKSPKELKQRRKTKSLEQKKRDVSLKKLRRERSSKYECDSVNAVKTIETDSRGFAARQPPSDTEEEEWLEAPLQARFEQQLPSKSHHGLKASGTTSLTARPIPDTLGRSVPAKKYKKHRSEEIETKVKKIVPLVETPTFRKITVDNATNLLQKSGSMSTSSQRSVRIKDDLNVMRRSYLETKTSLDSSMNSNEISPQNDNMFLLPGDAFDSASDDDSTAWRVKANWSTSTSSQNPFTHPIPAPKEQREPAPVVHDDRLGGIHIRTTVVESKSPTDELLDNTDAIDSETEFPPPSAYRTIML